MALKHRLEFGFNEAQHNGRGNAGFDIRALVRRRCFNEAPAQWPGKSIRLGHAAIGSCFNEAQHNGRGNQELPV